MNRRPAKNGDMGARCKVGSTGERMSLCKYSGPFMQNITGLTVQMKRSRLIAIVIALVGAIYLFSEDLVAETRSFRYELTTISGDPKYETELTNKASFNGPRYDVDFDPQGRLTRVAYIQQGKTNSEYIYLFGARERLPHGYKAFEGGELTGEIQIQRNRNGSRKRVNFLTSRAALTSYETYGFASLNDRGFYRLVQLSPGRAPCCGTSGGLYGERELES